MTDDELKPEPKRRVWLIVLLAVGIPVLCGLVCCGGLGYLGWGAVKGVLAATENAKTFLSDLSAKRVDEAYKSTSSGFKKSSTLDDFRTFVAKYPAFTGSSNPAFSGWQLLQGPGPKKTVVRATVVSGANSVTCTITLVMEDDVWKVDGFTVP
jgi:hypothetical protein